MKPSVKMFFVTIVAASSMASVALGDEARVRQPAPVLAAPDDDSAERFELRRGETVEVRKAKGAWVKIKAKDGRGWVRRDALAFDDESAPRARAADDEAEESEFEDEEEAPAPRFGIYRKGERVVVVDRAAARNKPSDGGRVLHPIEPGDQLQVTTQYGDWVQVEDVTDKTFWVPAAAIRRPGERNQVRPRPLPPETKTAAADLVEEEDPDQEEQELELEEDGQPADDEEAGATRGGRSAASSKPAVRSPTLTRTRSPRSGERWYQRIEADAGAELGVLSYSQAFSSGGAGVRGNYGVASMAPSARVAAAGATSFGRWRAGAHGWFSTTLGADDIAVPEGTDRSTSGEDASLSWSSMSMGAGLTGAYVLNQPWTVTAGLGYEMHKRSVGENMTIGLPSEVMTGVSMFAGGEYTRGRWVGAATVDTLMMGKLAQSEASADGTRNALTRFGGSLAGSWLWKPRLSLEARWSYARTKFAFGGDSTRAADAEGGTRTDQEHTLGVGARWAF